MPARTSGEIVNATLLEIFLALTFIVLAVAWVEQEGRTDAERAQAALQDTLANVRQASAHLDSVEKSNVLLQQKVDSFVSTFPPYCVDRASAIAVELTLEQHDNIGVRVVRSAFGLHKGDSATVPITRFADHFAEVRDSSLRSRCRYRALMRDSPAISKEQYKRARLAIGQVFYPSDGSSQ